MRKNGHTLKPCMIYLKNTANVWPHYLLHLTFPEEDRQRKQNLEFKLRILSLMTKFRILSFKFVILAQKVRILHFNIFYNCCSHFLYFHLLFLIYFLFSYVFVTCAFQAKYYFCSYPCLSSEVHHQALFLVFILFSKPYFQDIFLHFLPSSPIFSTSKSLILCQIKVIILSS